MVQGDNMVLCWIILPNTRLFFFMDAFLMLTNDKKIQIFGPSDYKGGNKAEIENVKNIYSNLSAFAVLTENGYVNSWGSLMDST